MVNMITETCIVLSLRFIIVNLLVKHEIEGLSKFLFFEPKLWLKISYIQYSYVMHYVYVCLEHTFVISEFNGWCSFRVLLMASIVDYVFKAILYMTKFAWEGS